MKVLAELPIIVVLMYQLYKAHVHQEVADFIPLIMNTIILTPSNQQRCVSVKHGSIQIRGFQYSLFFHRLFKFLLQTASNVQQGSLRRLHSSPDKDAFFSGIHYKNLPGKKVNRAIKYLSFIHLKEMEIQKTNKQFIL